MKPQIIFTVRGETIPRKSWEQHVPKYWYQEFADKNEGVYSYGTYKAILVPLDFDDIVEALIDQEIEPLLYWAQQNASREEREQFAIFASLRTDFRFWNSIKTNTKPRDHFASATEDWDFYEKYFDFD